MTLPFLTGQVPNFFDLEGHRGIPSKRGRLSGVVGQVSATSRSSQLCRRGQVASTDQLPRDGIFEGGGKLDDINGSKRPREIAESLSNPSHAGDGDGASGASGRGLEAVIHDCPPQFRGFQRFHSTFQLGAGASSAC